MTSPGSKNMLPIDAYHVIDFDLFFHPRRVARVSSPLVEYFQLRAMAVSQINASGVPQMMTCESHPARVKQIVNGVSRTKKMMILCGDVATQESSLPVCFFLC